MKNQKFLLFITLFVFGYMCWSQTVISGKVLDEGGFGLPGANIIELGTQSGASTDFDGNFSFTTKKKYGKIVISFIGYKTKEINFSPAVNKFDNIQLKLSNEILDEVIVIGYGSKKKEDLSTAIDNVKLDQGIKSRPSTSVESLLQGKLAGVTIQSNGGNPLAGSSINIRGMGSFNDNKALYVVDGVPNAPFNIEDVESISVLKDGASAAIYGSYVGANGVIIVTTKKAKKGLQISLNSSKGVAAATNLPTPLTAEEYTKISKDAYAAAGEAYPTFLDEPYFQTTRTNWFDEIFRKAFIDHHALSVSGGSDKVTAFGSISYDKREGILHNTYKETIGAMLKADFEVTKWLKLSERLSYTNTTGQGAVNTGNHEGVIAQALMFPRSSTIYDYQTDGSVYLDEFNNPAYHGTVPRNLQDSYSAFGEFRNPYATLQRLNEYRPTNRIYSTTSVAVEPISNLIFKSDYTLGLTLSRVEEFTPKVPETGNPNLTNFRSIYDSTNRNWLWENTINYKKSIEKHHFDALVGYTSLYENNRGNSIKASGFDREDGYGNIISQAEEILTDGTDEWITEESAASIITRLGYDYANRYFLTASARKDKNSKLPVNNNSKWFKSVSGAWKVSSEPFFDNLRDKINLLKLRASWGQIGNVNSVSIGSNTANLQNSDWTSYFGINGQNGTKGQFEGTAINEHLTWETSEQLDFGLDMELFNSLNITVDYFDKKTKDLITRGDYPTTSGLEAPYVNIGEVSNKGWEVGLKYHNKVGELNYNIYGNFSTVKSKVLSLDQKDYRFNRNLPPFVDLLRSKQGTPWYSYYLIKTDGIFQTQEEIDNYLFEDPITGTKQKIQPNAQPGDLKYIDYNNDGTITTEDRTYAGNYLPEITYSFGAGIDYKGIDFSFFFQGVSETEIFNGFKAYELHARGQQGYYSTRILDSWDYNKNSGIPRVSIVEDNNRNFSNASDFFLENGSYLRLKNITLGYTLPNTVMTNLGAKNAKLRLYFNGENVFTITDYSGMDPEVGNFGIDAGAYPLSRTFSLGLNFNY